MKDAAVSVIVVTHQSAAHLSACMAGLEAAAGGLVLERIVIDNASTDGTAELVAAQWPGVRLLRRSENLGFARAVNEAAREASAPLLLLLNPDARMRPSSLGLLVVALRGDPTAALAGPRLVGPGGVPQATAWRDLGVAAVIFEALMLDVPFGGNPLHFLPDTSEGRPRPVPCLSGASLLVRRSAFAELGGFDERFFLYHEDFDLCRRARSAGHAVLLAPEAVVEHELGGSAFRDRRLFLAWFHTSRRALLLKQHPGWRGRAIAAIHRAGIALRAGACRVGATVTREEPWREKARDWHHVAQSLTRKGR
jgi:N-acetylglucosaminyl-diphospho-decaprenol L-rhamnosyltransferase